LPGGNSERLYESLTQKLAKLPDETILYPGHNYDDVTSLALSGVKKRNRQMGATSFAHWASML
jgi:hydroxyacylglutathione hydrolase